MCSDTRTDVQADPNYLRRRKKMYIYDNRHLNCFNDEKNQRFYNNQFGSYETCRNNLLQYKVTCKCFIDFLCLVH